jgi:hypothetical protein
MLQKTAKTSKQKVRFLNMMAAKRGKFNALSNGANQKSLG